MLLRNFGRNIRFTPNRVYLPRNEDEVLALLERHKAGRIRVIGSLHSWSQAAETDDVLVDLQLLDWVGVPQKKDAAMVVTVGGGCRIRRLMKLLRRRASLTLPTVGTVMEQTVAGAISTATHGSGCSSLSHYVTALRVAGYDATGRPVIHEWHGGDDVRAARCALGCAGIILSVTFECVPMFHVAERVTTHNSIEPILSSAAEEPLQEFALVPHRWTYIAYQRRVDSRRVGWRWLVTFLYRAYKLIVVDCVFHALLKAVLFSNRLVRLLFRATPVLVGPAKLLTRGRGAVDRNDCALTRKHHYFRHIEMEVFVPLEHVVQATMLLRTIIGVCAGDSTEMPEAARTVLEKTGQLDRLQSLQGTYLHHYPLYFRRVHPDDTMISMTSGNAEYYAIGIFCYHRHRRRRPYFQFTTLIASVLMQACNARLHWGKYVPAFPQKPVTHGDVERLYPQLVRFQRWCEQIDPQGVFRNDYARRVLGLRRPQPARKPRNPRRVETVTRYDGRLGGPSGALEVQNDQQTADGSSV
jgi:FAD/FMN-containing dehydrogenase